MDYRNEGLLDSHRTKTSRCNIYLHLQNPPEYAVRMVDRLTRRSQQISSHPMSGRTVPAYEIDKIREVIECPYRIIYHIKSDQIDVIAVIHGAMDILSEKESK